MTIAFILYLSCNTYQASCEDMYKRADSLRESLLSIEDQSARIYKSREKNEVGKKPLY